MCRQIMKTNSTIKYGIIPYSKLEESTAIIGSQQITNHLHYSISTKRDSVHFQHNERASQTVKLLQWWRGSRGTKETRILSDFLGRPSMIADNMKTKLICSRIRTSLCTLNFARVISSLKVTKLNRRINQQQQQERTQHRWKVSQNSSNYKMKIVVFLVNLRHFSNLSNQLETLKLCNKNKLDQSVKRVVSRIILKLAVLLILVRWRWQT